MRGHKLLKIKGTRGKREPVCECGQPFIYQKSDAVARMVHQRHVEVMIDECRLMPGTTNVSGYMLPFHAVHVETVFERLPSGSTSVAVIYKKI